MSLHLEPIEEWSQFFQDCNWYTFHPIMIEVEDDAVLGGFEFTLILLGLGFRFRWQHTETEDMASLKRQVESLKAGTLVTRPYEPPSEASDAPDDQQGGRGGVRGPDNSTGA